MLLIVKGKMRVTLPTTPTSPMVSHTNSHIVSITYSILTPLMTLASPNNDSLNDFDESKQVLVRTLWWDFLSSNNWQYNYHRIYYSIGTVKQTAINYYHIAMNFDSIYLLYQAMIDAFESFRFYPQYVRLSWIIYCFRFRLSMILRFKVWAFRLSFCKWLHRCGALHCFEKHKFDLNEIRWSKFYMNEIRCMWQCCQLSLLCIIYYILTLRQNDIALHY